MFEQKNPTVKNGDLIILKKSRNSLNHLEGKLLEVYSLNTGYFRVKIMDGGCVGTVYFGSSYTKDTYIIASRKEIAAIHRERLSQLQEECVALEKEIKELEKFPTEEDAIADKISKMIKSKGDVAGIALILKQLKEAKYV